MALTEEDKKFIDKSNKDSIKEFFKGFWEQNLEPVLNDIYGELKKLNNKVSTLEDKVGSLENKVDDISLKVDGIDRKLGAEISYRDRLEKRVKVLEKSH